MMKGTVDPKDQMEAKLVENFKMVDNKETDPLQTDEANDAEIPLKMIRKGRKKAVTPRTSERVKMKKDEVNKLIQTTKNNTNPSDKGENYETEFDLFGKSIANQLNSMPRNDALLLQLKIEELMTNFEAEMASNVQTNSSTEATPLCDENFIDIKMEITDDFVD